MKCASDTLADSRVQKSKNFLAFFSRLLPPPLRREAEKGMERKFLVLLRRSHDYIVFYHTIESRHNIGYTSNITMSDSSKKLAENMKKIRARKHMSQGDICRELGVDRAYISTIESGKQNPTLSTIERIAKALGVSVDELLK